MGKIRKRVEGFGKELNRAIKGFEDKSNFIGYMVVEIQQRSFVKGKTNPELL